MPNRKPNPIRNRRRLPPVDRTLFTAILPHGITPTNVTAGWDVPEDAAPTDPAISVMLRLRIDWSHNAPRIVTAHLYGIDTGFVPVPVTHIRLGAGGPLADPDVYDETQPGGSLVTDLIMTPLDSAPHDS